LAHLLLKLLDLRVLSFLILPVFRKPESVSVRVLLHAQRAKGLPHELLGLGRVLRKKGLLSELQKTHPAELGFELAGELVQAQASVPADLPDGRHGIVYY
jgi:hypothetical protein